MSREAILNESRKEEKKSNNKTSNDVCVDTADGYLALCLQYSQPGQNSICSLAIILLSERDRSITEERANKKANKGTTKATEAFSAFPASSIPYKTYSVFWPRVQL